MKRLFALFVAMNFLFIAHGFAVTETRKETPSSVTTVTKEELESLPAPRSASSYPEVVVRGEALGKTASAGTKTGTPLKYVPANIAVIPQEIVAMQGGTANVDHAIRNVSGVTQSSSSNYGFFNNYVIRGLNMNFLRDGIPDGGTINGYSSTATAARFPTWRELKS
jgi:outer membrane receptor for monomeric catechols